jgi:hypothetical protein
MTLATTEISPVQRERATLSGLETRLADAMDRRNKTAVEIARASAEVAAGLVNSPGKTRQPINVARNSLRPLNEQAKTIDAEIAIIRIDLRHARRALDLAEGQVRLGEEKRAAAANGATSPRLMQLEIRAPDGRVIRQWYRSIDDARKALQPGYEVTGQVISGNIVSPIGAGATVMDSLLAAHGDVLMEWLEARGFVAADKEKTVIVLPNNNREALQ